VILNAAVIWLIWQSIGMDGRFGALHPDLVDKRVITSGVFEALIAATVTQTGAVTWAMARFLFPNPSE